MEFESRNNANHEDLDEVVPGRQLAPVDGGKDAWLFLAAGFIIEGLTWGRSWIYLPNPSSYVARSNHNPILGFAFSYGVFQDYYSTEDSFRKSGNIAAIGTCALVIDMILPKGYCPFQMLTRYVVARESHISLPP